MDWDDIKSEKGAWDTLIWFSVLVMMADQLNNLGLIPWFGNLVGNNVQGFSWQVILLILLLVYFYSHYMFASATAHVSAMYSAFLGVAIAEGVPPMLAALTLGFLEIYLHQQLTMVVDLHRYFLDQDMWIKINGGV